MKRSSKMNRSNKWLREYRNSGSRRERRRGWKRRAKSRRRSRREQ